MTGVAIVLHSLVLEQVLPLSTVLARIRGSVEDQAYLPAVLTVVHPQLYWAEVVRIVVLRLMGLLALACLFCVRVLIVEVGLAAV